MLKYGDRTAIGQLFQRFQKEASNMIDTCITLSYFMRGAVTYDQMLLKSHAERQRISEFIEKRLEQESKSMSPVY